MAYNPKTGKGLGRFYSAEHRAFRAREWRGFQIGRLPGRLL